MKMRTLKPLRLCSDALKLSGLSLSKPETLTHISTNDFGDRRQIVVLRSVAIAYLLGPQVIMRDPRDPERGYKTSFLSAAARTDCFVR